MERGDLIEDCNFLQSPDDASSKIFLDNVLVLLAYPLETTILIHWENFAGRLISSKSFLNRLSEGRKQIVLLFWLKREVLTRLFITWIPSSFSDNKHDCSSETNLNYAKLPYKIGIYKFIHYSYLKVNHRFGFSRSILSILSWEMPLMSILGTMFLRICEYPWPPYFINLFFVCTSWAIRILSS